MTIALLKASDTKFFQEYEIPATSLAAFLYGLKEKFYQDSFIIEFEPITMNEKYYDMSIKIYDSYVE